MDTPDFDLKSTDGKRETSTGAHRNQTTGKGRYDLIPAFFWRRFAKLFEKGAVAHGDRNWERGMPLSWYMDSGIRHALQAFNFEEDEDHAFQAVWNLMAFEWTKDEIRAGRLPGTLWDIGTPPRPEIKTGPQPTLVTPERATEIRRHLEQLTPERVCPVVRIVPPRPHSER